MGAAEEEAPEGAADARPATAATTVRMVLETNILNVDFCDPLRRHDSCRRIVLSGDIDDVEEEKKYSF